MPLWGKTDAVADQPKWLAKKPIPAGTTVLFVDRTEAQQTENRARGLKSPGWWLYKSWTNADGSVQYNTELLVALDNTAAAAGDQADDTLAVDRTITIGTAPTAQSVTAPAAATFSVVATVDPTTTLTYKWQTNGGSGTTYNDIVEAGVYSGVTTATLSISDSTGLNGYKYRVVVSATGATSKTTTGVTLTVA